MQTMILQRSSFCSVAPSQISSVFNQSRNQINLLLQQEFPLGRRVRRTRASTFKITCHGGELFHDIAQLAHNKVLIAAAASAVIGQLSKPFTSVFLYGKEFDLNRIIQAGGFPSTHSSATVASATFLALDRGFADPIFGLAIVYAGLIMYDAQGVRREVGIHARVLNKVLQLQLNSIHSKDRNVLINSQPGTPTAMNVESLEKSLLSQEPQPGNARLLIKSDKKTMQNNGEKLASGFSADAEELSKLAADGLFPLKESIGHTEVEVIAGALLGFLVGLTVYNFM